MKYLLSVLLAFTIFSTYAMKIEVQNNIVFASGHVDDDLNEFKQAFEKSGVDTVVFVNSPGGDLWTGLRVGRLIAEKGFKTVIAGSCSSACSIMFMGGKERTFSDAFAPLQTYIGIHGAHKKDTKSVDPQLQPQIFAFYKQFMSDKFNAEIINIALYEMEDSGSMLRVFDAARLPKRVTYQCKSFQSLRASCREFKDADVLNMGIVTSNVLTKFELPSHLKIVPRILGRELTQAFSDPAEYYKALETKQCSSDICRKFISNYSTNKEHKALAIPVNDMGVTSVALRNNAQLAYINAIYLCNHVKDKPTRLCETQTVNGFDIRDFYTSGTERHAEALAKLSPPADNFYANEEYGGSLTSATGLRTQKWNDITPQKLDGIKTYITKELATALKGDQPPVVINVLTTVSEAIPGAITIANGGIALEDLGKDAELEARFAGLLKLLSPDLNKPIVFYCASRELWLSVNAAMRAKKLGYTNVGWYRGGYQSWKAANLPMADVMVRAVVN